MVEQILLEVEDNENCDYMPQQLFEARAGPVTVLHVRLEETDMPHGVYEVTGWSSDGPCPALYAPVSDSGQAEAHLVFGGDWGIRLRPVDSRDPWDLTSARQWGLPFLVLIDAADVLLQRGA